MVNKESKNAQNAANRRSDIFSPKQNLFLNSVVAAVVDIVVVIVFVVESAAVVVAVVVAWGKNSFKFSCEVPTSIREGIHQNSFWPPSLSD